MQLLPACLCRPDRLYIHPITIAHGSFSMQGCTLVPVKCPQCQTKYHIRMPKSSFLWATYEVADLYVLGPCALCSERSPPLLPLPASRMCPSRLDATLLPAFAHRVLVTACPQLSESPSCCFVRVLRLRQRHGPTSTTSESNRKPPTTLCTATCARCMLR